MYESEKTEELSPNALRAQMGLRQMAGPSKSIDEHFTDLDDALTNLEDAIERIQMRIVPVLGPDNNPKSDGDVMTQPEASALATMVMVKTAKIRRLNHSLADTLQRIEL